ncbi:hypothetical protein ACERK3_09440 [Phycisphaerales bacterium AB-hyl4]|uniref:Transposase n=1 Tax=Natronomicrosphaera hydrolytica TaxID=3242702 RepID=A0ABV4U6E0_9BACT
MVDTLEKFLAQGVGVGQVVIDGTTVRYDRKQAMDELEYWRRRLARQERRRRRFSTIDLRRV